VSALGVLRTRTGLTGRGWTFLAFGGLLALVGIWQGLAPAIQFGALVGLLPVAAGLLIRGPRSDLQLQRTLSARELYSGDELRVTVSVRGRFPRGRSLLLEDLADPALGGAHRFALNGMTGQGVSRPHYRVRVGARGLHHLGPMRIHVVDRFGMIHRVVTVGGRDEVLVAPRVVALDPMVLGVVAQGAGSGHLGTPGQAADDVIPRDYRPGDEVRRIDWKASARTGALMVRSEEHPWRSALTVVIDLHESDHRGVEPDSSVDTALSAAASIGALALSNGWDLTVLTTDYDLLFAGSPMTGVDQERRALLRALATAPLSHVPVPSPELGHTSAAAGPVILIAGSMSLPSARVLSGVGAHSPQRMLMALAAEQWATPARNATIGGPAGSPGQLTATAEALAVFRGSGWRVSRVERDTGVAAGWSALGVR
jgi:uncharacterized protein (DUF58 family)